MKTYSLKEPSAAYVVSQDMIPTDEPLILMREGQPVAALLPFAEYERYREWRAQQSPKTQPWPELEMDRRAWLAMKDELLKTHRGQYVCFRHGQLIDADPDEQLLIERVRARFPDGPIYVQAVLEQPRVYHLRSPKVVRA